MAEQMMVVCDDCGAPAVATILLRVTNDGGRSYEKDVCEDHRSGMFENTRPSKRGRKRAIPQAGATPRRRGRRKSTAKSTAKRTRKRSTAKKTTRRRRREEPAVEPNETVEEEAVSA